MADIQYDPACMDCRHDAVKDPAGTTWQCNGHVRAERDWLRAKLANVMVEWKHDVEVLTKERNAALKLSEQRGAAYDLTWREVESLREWKDKLEEKMDKITALVDDWRDGRAHLGTPATFVDQRLLDGILNTGVTVSGQRGGTVTFSHWSGAATKPDDEHGDGGPPEEWDLDDVLDRATACDECGAIGPVYLCGASVRCGRCAGIYEEQNHEP